MVLKIGDINNRHMWKIWGNIGSRGVGGGVGGWGQEGRGYHSASEGPNTCHDTHVLISLCPSDMIHLAVSIRSVRKRLGGKEGSRPNMNGADLDRLVCRTHRQDILEVACRTRTLFLECQCK